MVKIRHLVLLLSAESSFTNPYEPSHSVNQFNKPFAGSEQCRNLSLTLDGLSSTGLTGSRT
jgi:hypothetical protein